MLTEILSRKGQAALLLVLGMICIPEAALADRPAPTSADGPLMDHLTIVAPSTAGGGWDRTAQAMKQTLEAEGIVRSVQVVRSPGAGGLIGLAQFAGGRWGSDDALLVGGMFMVGAAVWNKAEVSLLDTVPIARLTGDYAVVAVPQSSPYRSLGDLLEAMQVDPGAMRWGGGSAGGPDQLVVWQLARIAAVDPSSMHYDPSPGGHDVARQLANGRYVAAVSSYSEFAEMLQRGDIRALAISSPAPLPGVAIPTFSDLGIAGISQNNWRGVFAPPGVDAARAAHLQLVIQRMVESERWGTLVQRNQWKDIYVNGEKFGDYVRAEWRRINRSEPFAAAMVDTRMLPSAHARRLSWALWAGVAVAALLGVIVWQRRVGRAREALLKQALSELSQDAERRTGEIEQRAKSVEERLAGMHAQIEREFDRWGFTAAERSVAHLMLKGLRLKDIARIRKTSDRTVRQQAQVIYRKSGVEGRTDLSAYFLEDMLAPVTLSAPPPVQLVQPGNVVPPSAPTRAHRAPAGRAEVMPRLAGAR